MFKLLNHHCPSTIDRWFLLLTLFVTGCVSAQNASASLVFRFDSATYSVAPGGTVDISVSLIQTSPTTVLTDEGLIAGGVRVFFDDPTPADPATVQSIPDITINPAFDDSLLGADVDVDANVSAGFEDSVDDILSPIIGNEIFLGTFAFTAGNSPLETTQLRATDFSAGGNNIAGDFTVLDAFIADGFASITTTATAVPEPSSAIICLLVAAARLTRKRRHVAFGMPPKS
ncbi:MULTISPECIES: hypothetical protein [Rhodopirellula]|jgi:hypothetical protein|uniref:hypothetical protein n=1 Tax=Rhodopirellula TaxID=265488 RepID=UPI00257CCDB9|nr:hypothetical protein [Rhodopirellula sp. UBA1907]|tara:strand:- start:980 stop:1669 length:690 start_codon:yes stop_codon:yes gene_type:complete